MEELAELIQNGKAKRIIVLCGAGISTGAGIPDFRSPGTGLYDNLSKYNLPYPEAIFDVNYYRKRPDAFVTLAKELWPGITFKPTMTHHFLKVLADKGLLLRIYTQNIDGLEFLAGIPDDKLVECHGHFRSACCIDCNKASDIECVKDTITKEGKTPTCTYCIGNVKPDIVFFGEDLPDRFHKLLKKDIPQADLLLVMGTSLQVAPVSMIPDMVRCNRVLFNRDKVMKIRSGDIFVPGDCDSNVEELSSLLGWTLLQTGTETEVSSHNDKEKELNEEELSNLLGSCEINDEQTNHTDKEDNDEDEDEDDDDEQASKDDDTNECRQQ
ncbi:NAD-dependent deacetylase sirtuin-2 [Fragilariopsis cylindrus CCMP1102]|uniref:NAD-dependent protein deacetylase n=1 Tax=Fragilariopsis cylindrus CCMP1102 TaxID=635003 RepID=A0A1E7FDD4_9STRA|nr:NAD-dependent deacetylase sirtuin-2 [Fragilariopsis cylindrus CCMP1102]|eukprot:OEU16136.1 NAD-dependent deacetylase sirtuin-2 [Fragilariopsis cylindrus CCMP1102]